MTEYGETQVILAADSTLNEEVFRNVKVILTTPEGSVPYDREFGIRGEILDLPAGEVKGLYTVECVTKVRRYEPRASVVAVEFSHDAIEGVVYPKVVIQIEAE
ncbi:GPW/gp25 family protein [Sporosarcina sp. FSL K6-1508]|uniref:GPW/gp25 family protein n=1 Tax=Sporosarcina sp. FSL K6-1508 TaxID=2921553 RepID=UPI0030F9B04E